MIIVIIKINKVFFVFVFELETNTMKRRKSQRLANKKRQNSTGMCETDDDDDDNESIFDQEEEEDEQIDHYKPREGDIVFAWYYENPKNKDTAFPWWPAKIMHNNKLRFFWQL